MIPLQGLVPEQERHYHGKDRKGDDFLDHFQLDKVERAAVVHETQPVRRDLGAVLEKCDSPGKKDDQNQGPSGRDFHFLKFQVPVPGNGHKDVRSNQKQNRIKCSHCLLFEIRGANLETV